MRVPASPWVILGLEPGAGRAEIEEAYRRLIKLHHPDRSGGDAGRAAEINRAYSEIRRQHDISDPLPPFVPPRPSRPARTRRSGRPRRGTWWPLVLALGVLLFVERERVAEQGARWSDWLAGLGESTPGSVRGRSVPVDPAALDGPLNEPVIARSIGEAVALAGSGGGLAEHSRSCHRELRSEPGLARFDRCAAFDDAVVVLAERAPMKGSGAFDASAVTARQLTAARLLSSDFLAIERRLDRIRLMVNLALMPRAPSPPPPTANLVSDDPQLAPEAGDAAAVPEGT